MILSEIKRLIREYSDIPPEAVVKQDILRLGIRFSEDSCGPTRRYKTKDYFIFSFDLDTLQDLKKEGKHWLMAPEEIRISGGEFGLKPAIINVRLNASSPYLVKIRNGRPALYCEGKNLGRVEYHPYPEFYSSKLSSGKKISEIAPVMEWGYLVYLTVFRLCQYWGKNEECQFCDINENYRQQKKEGREYTGVKKLSDVVEALEHINKKDHFSKAVTITGGSVVKKLSGKREADFYAEYARAVKQKFGDRWLIKTVVEAFNAEDCRKLLESGVDIYHPNYEVWENKLFKTLCPGKEKHVGRNKWMRRIVEAAEIFGPRNVIPNFVAGVEMARPFGFKDLHEAVESTGKGLEYFMSKSIVPRFTTWCREPLAYLKNQPPPPLEYYVKLLRVWRDTMEKYQLPAPPGYGEHGAGKAVFSVSAFMDVVRS